jgi:hypothetical protein
LCARLNRIYLHFVSSPNSLNKVDKNISGQRFKVHRSGLVGLRCFFKKLPQKNEPSKLNRCLNPESLNTYVIYIKNFLDKSVWKIYSGPKFKCPGCAFLQGL